MARVARDNNLNQNQLAKWRRDYHEGLLGEPSPVRLVPISVAVCDSPVRLGAPDVQPALEMSGVGLELVLPKGRVLIHALPNTQLLRTVIEAMQ